MFNAVIPLSPPVIAVQVDEGMLSSDEGQELLGRLEAYFMTPVVLVAWDRDAKFLCRGAACPENDLISEDLDWREFELPPEPEIPF